MFVSECACVSMCTAEYTLACMINSLSTVISLKQINNTHWVNCETLKLAMSHTGFKAVIDTRSGCVFMR